MTGGLPGGSALGPRIANEVELPSPPPPGSETAGPAFTGPAISSPAHVARPTPTQPTPSNLTRQTPATTTPINPSPVAYPPHYDRTRSALTGPVGSPYSPQPYSTSGNGPVATPTPTVAPAPAGATNAAAPYAAAPNSAASPTPSHPTTPRAVAIPGAPPTALAAQADPVHVPTDEKYLSRHELDGVSRQAEVLVARGYELADRRMLYAARQQFIQALQVIAQALDAHEAKPYHALALVNGLQALEEAGEFQARSMDVDRTVQDIALGHRTPVLGKLTRPISALAAGQLYYAHAQEQLSLAVSPVPAGSAALCALGKLHVEFGREEASFIRNSVPQVKVFHQAALLVDTNNWEAANELAVFLVQSGNTQEARGWLQHSVRVSPRAENWHNLAAVHRRFGETDLAIRADAEARRLAGRGPDGQPLPVNSPVDVQWMDPQEFAQRPTVPQDSMPNNSANNTGAPPGVASARRNSAPPQGLRQAEAPADSRGWKWLPWVR